jgi:hypothetical protein
MSTKLIFFTVLAISLLSSCSKDDTSPANGECFADNISLTQTDLIDYTGSHSVFITFDAKNTSRKDYNVDKGAKLVNLKIIVTTTDSAHYETHIALTKTAIGAGQTTTAMISADYGAGKTYCCYQVFTSCN